MVLLLALLPAVLLAGGCALTVSDLARSLGRTLPAGRAHPELQAEPDRWVLVENPLYEEEDPAGRREPPFVWAERDRLPLTLNRVIGGRRAVLAPPEVAARYAADKSPPRAGPEGP